MTEIRLELRGAFVHQQEMLACDSRFICAAGAVKSGKSAGAALWSVRELIPPGRRGLWMAPTLFQSTSIGMELVAGLLPKEFSVARYGGTAPSLTLSNDSTISFRSGDEPDSLYGSSHNFVVVDEACRVIEASWTAARSTLTATRGRALCVSNPGPRTSWFARLWARGMDPNDSDVQSFRWPTRLNPLVDPGEIESARRDMTERNFAALYEGQFLDGSGAVFTNATECAVGSFSLPVATRLYTIGFDVARTQDWNVLTCVDVESGSVVAWLRWHGTSWELSVQRAAEMSKKYNRAVVTTDSTGVGDVVVEQLERAGVPVSAFRFTNASKAQLVENLAVKLEKREISFPPIPQLLNELDSFEGTTSPITGVVRYGAPPGQFDDAAISLALAAWGTRNYSQRLTLADIGGGRDPGGWGDVPSELMAWGNPPSRGRDDPW